MKDILQKRGLQGKLIAAFFALLLSSFSMATYAQTGCVKADFDFTVDHTTGTVKFEAKASSNAVLFVWDFGSGATTQGSTVTRTFSSSGVYEVCLIVYAYNTSTQQRCSVKVCKKVEIRKCDLKADFAIHTDGLTIKVEGKSNSNHAVYGYTFGDGSGERGREAKHKYDSFGKYTVCFFVKDTVTGCTAKVCKDIALRKCDLEVGFEFSQDGNDFKFRAKASTTNAVFVWDFGDGTDGKGSEVKHSYRKPGVYRVCVTAIIANSTGTERCTATVCKKVEIEERKDTCDLRGKFVYEVDGRGIKVKAESNEDDVVYFWSWGDGTSGHGQKAKHKYDKYGVYEVCLIIFNPKTHCKICVCKKVVIERPCTLKADFKYRVDGNKVMFKARSNGHDVVYGWIFGDGDDGRGSPIRHAYDKPGTYKVTLIAYDKRTGCKVEITKRIIINPRKQLLPDAEISGEADIAASSNVQATAPDYNWTATAFPVPTQNQVTFTSTDKVLTHATIYGLDGNKLLDIDLDFNSNEDIDITTLPTGLYYAHVTALDGSVKIVKFLKN